MSHEDSTWEAPRFTVLESRLAPLPFDHVDTDQIIPAAYLKTVRREGLADGLFAGWRGREIDGRPFVLDDPRFAGAQILLAGDNFGCGSSREHAPWALYEYGFRAVVSTSFADIFRSNALENGLLPVEVAVAVHRRLLEHAFEHPEKTLRIDLERQVLTAPWGEEIAFTVAPFARRCLLQGIDSLGYLLSHLPVVEAWEASHPAVFDTRVLTAGEPAP